MADGHNRKNRERADYVLYPFIRNKGGSLSYYSWNRPRTWLTDTFSVVKKSSKALTVLMTRHASHPKGWNTMCKNNEDDPQNWVVFARGKRQTFILKFTLRYFKVLHTYFELLQVTLSTWNYFINERFVNFAITIFK